MATLRAKLREPGRMADDLQHRIATLAMTELGESVDRAHDAAVHQVHRLFARGRNPGFRPSQAGQRRVMLLIPR